MCQVLGVPDQNQTQFLSSQNVLNKSLQWNVVGGSQGARVEAESSVSGFAWLSRREVTALSATMVPDSKAISEIGSL